VDDFRIPKWRAASQVTFTDGSTRALDFFVSEQVREHGGPERLSDLLSGHELFLVAIDPSSNEVLFVCRHDIEQLQVAASLEALPPEEEADAQEHALEISLLGGRKVKGLVRYARPPDHARVLDFLNEVAPFLLVTQGDMVVFVNKGQVRSIAMSKS
jgi:hypothetical protein